MLNRWYPPLPPEVRSRIITLWSVLLVAVVLVGGVALSMGTFIRSNVRDQLAAQQIVFAAAAELTPDEQAEDACLTQYAGALMTTGDQARCYSDHYIALHTKESAARAGFPGATYATLGREQTQLRSALAAAQQAGTQDAVKAATDRLTAAGTLRTTMQTASTLRGQLLNAWGWDTVGIGIIATGAAIVVLGLVAAVALIYELTHKSVPSASASETRPAPGAVGAPALAAS